MRRLAERSLAAMLVLLAASAALGGCGARRQAAAGVEPAGDGVIVTYKPCQEGQGIARMQIFGPRNQLAWWARADSPRAARTSLRIPAGAPGYQVVSRPGLRDGITYRVEAESTNGQSWGGPSFDPAKLRTGEVLSAGKRVSASAWHAATASCNRRSAGTIAVGALLAGGAAAAMAIVILGPLWLLRRVAVRRAREREGHLPWLHDPPPRPGLRLWPFRRRARRPTRPPAADQPPGTP